MKRFLLSIIMAVGICATGYSQTNTTTTVPQFLADTYQFLIGEGLTNLSVTAYATYTPSLKEWGEGLAIMRLAPLGSGIYTGIGIGLDHYMKQWYAVTAQATLGASLRPLQAFGATNFIMTPFTFVGIGTPFGEDSEGTSGNLETIASIGAAFRLAKLGPGYLEFMGTYGTRTGVGGATGTFYGGGVNYTIRF